MDAERKPINQEAGPFVKGPAIPVTNREDDLLAQMETPEPKTIFTR